MTRTTFLFLAAVGALLVAAGCGGGDRLSQAEFQEQGNAICARYEKQIEAIGTPNSLEEIPGYVDKALPIVEREIEELEDLKPPEDDQEAFDEMLAEAKKTLAAGRDLGAAAEQDDQDAIEKALNEGNTASDRADAHAQDLGLEDCVDEGE
jgi:hypothetical protein